MKSHDDEDTWVWREKNRREEAEKRQDRSTWPRNSHPGFSVSNVGVLRSEPLSDGWRSFQQHVQAGGMLCMAEVALDKAEYQRHVGGPLRRENKRNGAHFGGVADSSVCAAEFKVTRAG